MWKVIHRLSAPFAGCGFLRSQLWWSWRWHALCPCCAGHVPNPDLNFCLKLHEPGGCGGTGLSEKTTWALEPTQGSKTQRVRRGCPWGCQGPVRCCRSTELLWHRSKIWASSCLTSHRAGGHEPSRDPGQSLGPGLGTHGGHWGPLLMCPQTLSDPNNGDGHWPGQARISPEPLPEPRTWGWE